MNEQRSTRNISNNGIIDPANFHLSSEFSFVSFSIVFFLTLYFTFLFCLCCNAMYLCIPDDKKLGGVLKKMGFTEMKGMEEVNIFKDDGTVIHIKQPKSNKHHYHSLTSYDHHFIYSNNIHLSLFVVQMSVPANTYVVSGPAEVKKMEELLPGILNQLGPESMDRLREFATSQYGGAGAGGAADEEEEPDDDDVPDLVENFEEAAAK